MRVLSIGGAGTLGREIASVLSSDLELSILDRTEADVPGATCIRGDATDRDVLERALAGMDGVLHLAAVVPRGPENDDPDRLRAAFDVNVTGLYLALRTAASLGVTNYVHVSTMSVFAEYGRVPVDPTVTPDATTAYGLTKRLAEQACAAVAATSAMTVSSLRLAFPTTAAAWPRWVQPASSAPPRRPRLDDGTEFDALGPEDLSRAVLAALRRRGPYEAVPVTGDTHGVSLVR